MNGHLKHSPSAVTVDEPAVRLVLRTPPPRPLPVVAGHRIVKQAALHEVVRPGIEPHPLDVLQLVTVLAELHRRDLGEAEKALPPAIEGAGEFLQVTLQALELPRE